MNVTHLSQGDALTLRGFRDDRPVKMTVQRLNGTPQIDARACHEGRMVVATGGAWLEINIEIGEPGNATEPAVAWSYVECGLTAGVYAAMYGMWVAPL